jgi:hypothetical protein
MKMVMGAVVILALAGGCTNSQALLSEDQTPHRVSLGTEAGTAASADASIPGARPVQIGQAAARPGDKPMGAGIYNSDNRGIITRSGLNSDPNNPSGMPGRPSAPAGG